MLARTHIIIGIIKATNI